MIFEFTDIIREIDFTDFAESNNTVGYISASEFGKFYMYLGFDADSFSEFSHNDKYFRSKITAEKEYCYGTLKIIEPEINSNVETRLAFYIKKNLVLIIDINDTDHYVRERFIETVNRFEADKFKPEHFISAFIDELISSDNKGLEDIEFEINRIEDKILQENGYKNFNEELLKYKRRLLSLRNYYEQLIDIGESLSNNENRLFDENSTEYFRSFIRKSERLCYDVNLLRDNLIQLRETYQSNLDLKLNNTMKLFTVITAIFSPLTLIAGWYGMNFRYMPELEWKYGYFYVIVLSLTVLSACIIIFKKKKLL